MPHPGRDPPGSGGAFARSHGCDPRHWSRTSGPPMRSHPDHMEVGMGIERLIRIFAGSFVLLSLALGVEGSPLFLSARFLWFTAFVGANLLQSGFTRFCPLETVLRRVCAAPRAGSPSA